METKAKTRIDRWHEKVVAAQNAVAEAEKNLSAASNPVEQTLAFRELTARKQTLQQTLWSKS